MSNGWRHAFGPYLCIALGVLGVSATRGPQVRAFTRAKETHDLYVLPSPQRTVVMSLGYRSALADLMFGHVLVSSGLHLGEKRNYETAAGYLQTINELDPKFASPYRFADTILTLQAKKSTLLDYQATRAILERGMRELPYDGDLWLTAGQFLAYLAPPRIKELVDEATSLEWRNEGIKRLARSCELVGSRDALPQHCLSTASLISRSGERDAYLQFVQKILAVTDDPEVHEQALRGLSQQLGKDPVGEEQVEQMKRRGERLERRLKSELPFVGKNRYLLLGPRVDAYGCFGEQSSQLPHCATSWRDYHQRMDVSPQSVD